MRPDRSNRRLLTQAEQRIGRPLHIERGDATFSIQDVLSG
jgi:hypothetical protein